MIFKFFAIYGTLFIINLSGSFAEEKRYDIFYDGMESTKGHDIEIDLKMDLNVEKIGPIQFNISGYVEHNFELNDQFNLKLTVFKADQKDGEYRKKIETPRKGTCALLKNEYKRYFYESLKDCSNAPHYDTCPLPPAKYTITNYIFDASAFKRFFSPGYFYVLADVSQALISDFIFRFKIDLHIEDIAQ